MKFTVEVEEFWLEDEELSTELQAHVKTNVVREISSSIKDNVETQITKKVKEVIEQKIEIIRCRVFMFLLPVCLVCSSYARKMLWLYFGRTLDVRGFTQRRTCFEERRKQAKNN